jgi:hypothetical protein
MEIGQLPFCSKIRPPKCKIAILIPNNYKPVTYLFFYFIIPHLMSSLHVQDPILSKIYAKITRQLSLVGNL